MKLWAEPFHQWQFLYTRCNWYDFTIIKVHGEWDHKFGNVEAVITIVGFGVRVVLNYAITEDAQRLARKIAAIHGGDDA